MATHSSILAWRTHGRRSLVGYSPQGLKESNTTEQLHRGGGNAPYCTNRQRIFLTHPGSCDSVVTTTLRENSPIPRLMLFLQVGILDPVGSNLRSCERPRDPTNQEGWICHHWST